MIEQIKKNLLPIGISVIILLTVNRIPYVNLFAQEFIVLLLSLTWIILKRRMHISTNQTVYFVLFLFGLTFILDFVDLRFYSEAIGNFIFVLLVLTVISNIFKKA